MAEATTEQISGVRTVENAFLLVKFKDDPMTYAVLAKPDVGIMLASVAASMAPNNQLEVMPFSEIVFKPIEPPKQTPVVLAKTYHAAEQIAHKAGLERQVDWTFSGCVEDLRGSLPGRRVLVPRGVVFWGKMHETIQAMGLVIESVEL